MRFLAKSILFGIFIIVLIPPYISIHAQMGNAGTIAPITDSDKAIPFIVLEQASHADYDVHRKSTENGIPFKSGVFGKLVSTAISAELEGVWFSNEKGVKINRLGICSAGASSLSLIFKDFHLLPGIKLFVYSPDRKTVHGAYTYRNNKESEVFPISPIPGDSLIVEFQVFGNGINFGDCLIDGVGIGYARNENLKDAEDEWYQKSEACEVDINCINETNVQKHKKSVVRIIYDGSKRCTGTLLNNTAFDGKPFVLTAGHCIETAAQANNAIYYFGYESPYCEGPDGELKSISGSSLLSSGNGALDFSLVELSEAPSSEYDPLYSGWDTRNNASDYTYIIHHPEGDVKKFAEDVDPKHVATFNNYDENTHWLIPDYEQGTTEDGSSGAPLFNDENRLIGSLSGGGEACSEFIYDYYQNFSDCWDNYPLEGNQLKAWLDPTNTAAAYINSFQLNDPYLEYAERLSNIDSSETVGTIHNTQGWGYVSGHNSEGNAEYGEHFSVKGSKYIYAIEMDISHAYTSTPDSRFTILIRDLDTGADNIIFQKDVFLFEMTPGIKNIIRLDTLILVDHNFSVGYTINYNLPIDTLAVTTVVPNSEKLNNTAYFRIDDIWYPLASGGEQYITAINIDLLVYDFPLPANPEDLENYPQNIVTIYPNPAYDLLQILFKEKPEGNVSVKVYDTFGRLIQVFIAESPEPNIQMKTDFLPAGVFILRIEYPRGVTSVKLIKN